MQSTQRAARMHPCAVCGKTFRRGALMRLHLLTHSTEYPHACVECGKEFKLGASLQRHMSAHTGKRPYKCAECGKVFPIANNLKKHMRTHTGEKPYSCQVCKKSFCNGSNLKAHYKCHTGERQHACAVCSARFKLSGHLKAHMRTHAGDAMRDFGCSECHKAFTTIASLRRHVVAHAAWRDVTPQPSPSDIARSAPDATAHSKTSPHGLLSTVTTDRLYTHEGPGIGSCEASEVSIASQPLVVCEHALPSGGLCHSVPARHNNAATDASNIVKDSIGGAYSIGSVAIDTNISSGALNRANGVHVEPRAQTPCAWPSLAKPYSCAQCARGFMSADVLALHARAHGEELHRCTECCTTFTEEASLRKHAKVHQ